mgnify:CR=1 FL=1
MAAGIRVTVDFPTPSRCPIADLAASADATVRDVTTSVTPASDSGSVSEFLLPADSIPEDFDREPVFTYTGRHSFRVEHGNDSACPCACLGEFDTPIDRYVAEGGHLRLVFHAPDFETLQTIVAELRERFPDVDIQRLIRAPTEGAVRDTVFVDRGRLTDRQLEILRLAYDRGYFDRPRGANATELADELDITPSTLTEHLHTAQRKLLGDVFEDGQ